MDFGFFELLEIGQNTHTSFFVELSLKTNQTNMSTSNRRRTLAVMRPAANENKAPSRRMSMAPKASNNTSKAVSFFHDFVFHSTTYLLSSFTLSLSF